MRRGVGKENKKIPHYPKRIWIVRDGREERRGRVKCYEPRLVTILGSGDFQSMSFGD